MKKKNIKSFEKKSIVDLKQITGGAMDQQMAITDIAGPPGAVIADNQQINTIQQQ